MIIVALIGAAIFYVVLYCLWAMSSQHIVGISSWMNMLNDMIFMPGPLIFMLLRGLIFVTAIYVLSDSLTSTIKKIRRKRIEAKRQREEPFAVVVKRH
ncbi:hypothetical protein EON83_04540 [bacterium]|nr:MAG: hypothetical protein EON83_04540 [bacterium]